MKDLFIRYNSELKEQEVESVTLHYGAEDTKIDVIEEEDDLDSDEERKKVRQGAASLFINSLGAISPNSSGAPSNGF